MCCCSPTRYNQHWEQHPPAGRLTVLRACGGRVLSWAKGRVPDRPLGAVRRVVESERGRDRPSVVWFHLRDSQEDESVVSARVNAYLGGRRAPTGQGAQRALWGGGGAPRGATVMGPGVCTLISTQCCT